MIQLSTSIHDYWKNHSFDHMDLCWHSDVCFLITLSRFVITFFPRSKRLLISWLQSLPTVILEPKEIKSVTASTFPPSIYDEVRGTVVLEKTLESPLDCKEIQLVHPKGDQSWVFIGRTDAETETPILWPRHAKS